MNYVKKALLPKVKYHWDKGFRQASSGAWEKVPVVKMKVGLEKILGYLPLARFNIGTKVSSRRHLELGRRFLSMK